MFGSVLGISKTNNSDRETLFAEYAKATIILVQSDFSGSSDREKKEYLERVLKELEQGITFEEYQEEILKLTVAFKNKSLERIIELLDAYRLPEIKDPDVGKAFQEHIESLIEAQRVRIARLLGVIERINYLYKENGFEFRIDEKAILLDLQDYYMLSSPENEQAITENIWLSNQIFCTQHGLSDWEERQLATRSKVAQIDKIPQSLLDLTASLRRFYISIFQTEGNELDYSLLGETVIVSLDVVFSIWLQAHFGVFAQNETVEKNADEFQVQQLAVLDCFLESMLKTPGQLPGNVQDERMRTQEVVIQLSKTIEVRDSVEEKRIAESKEQYLKYRSQFNSKKEEPSKLLEAKTRCDETEEEDDFYRSHPVAKSIPASIASIRDEISTRKELQKANNELHSALKKLKDAKTAYENNLEMLENYPAVFLDAIRSHNAALATRPGLEKATTVLMGTTLAAGAATLASMTGDKEDNKSNLGGTAVAGIGAIASSIALSSAEDKLKKTDQAIERNAEVMKQSNWIVQNPDRIQLLFDEIVDLESERNGLQVKIDAIEKSLEDQKEQTKKGKIFLGVILGIILLVAVIFTISAAVDNANKYNSSTSYASSQKVSSSSTTKQNTSSTSTGSAGSSTKSSSTSNLNNASTSNATTARSETINSPYGYILPESDTRYYSESELNALTDYELYLARNEIYARYGREFKNQDLQDYFENKDWYTARYSPESFDSIVALNAYEKKNADDMLAMEKSRNSSYLS